MEKQKESKKITTIPELAKMINRSFQGNQEYMDEKFAKVDEKFDQVKKELKEEIKKVDTKLTTFIEDYKEEKLPMRVEYIENVLNLPKK